MFLHRSAERSLSEAMAQKAKAERAKCLLKARVTALSRGFREMKNSSTGGGQREARPTASDPLPQRSESSTSSSSACFRRGGDMVDPETGGGSGAASANDTLRGDEWGLGVGGRERTDTQNQPPQSGPQSGSEVPGSPHSPEGSEGYRHRHRYRTSGQKREQETKREEERVGVTDGQGRGRDRDRDTSRAGKEQLERENERLIEQAVERERRRFEVERQMLEKDRQEADQAAERAKARAEELNSAWQALADKVVSLANRNADLEWVSSGRGKGDGLM